MKKTLLIIAFCFVTLAIASFAMNINTRTGEASAQKPLPINWVPDEVKYSAFFHYVVDLNRQADELERAGKDATSVRMHIQIHAELNYEEARLLNEIASNCIKEVEQQDRKASAVIEKFRAKFPGGKVPAGVKLPPPPPELSAMQTERNRIILLARDTYRYNADAGYTKVNDFIQREIAPNLRPVKADKR